MGIINAQPESTATVNSDSTFILTTTATATDNIA
jgi:hypothetical protein